ncbi:hypothetical protein A2U01_0022018 [Trifolium medium]|uniref:Uncharacterized protein n=1 Tax=Trifolium medium TaxID=97028 RepID=A0A392NNN9_9FABA|nr:hypothetical protein [Trifolium medium]
MYFVVNGMIFKYQWGKDTCNIVVECVYLGMLGNMYWSDSPTFRGRGWFHAWSFGDSCETYPLCWAF